MVYWGQVAQVQEWLLAFSLIHQMPFVLEYFIQTLFPYVGVQ